LLGRGDLSDIEFTHFSRPTGTTIGGLEQLQFAHSAITADQTIEGELRANPQWRHDPDPRHPNDRLRAIRRRMVMACPAGHQSSIFVIHE
jgi:hypothetical protein